MGLIGGETPLKNASLMIALALAIAAPAAAQTDELDSPVTDAAPPDAAQPEPEVSQPEPEVSRPAESSDALGTAAPATTPTTTPTIAEDLNEATGGTTAAAAPTGDGDEPEMPPSMAERMAQAVPQAGVPWTFPITSNNTISFRTFRRNAQQTYDPFFQHSITVAPRWNFSSALSVGVIQTGNFEATSNDSTWLADVFNQTFKREWTWSDTRLDVLYTLPWRPGGISLAIQGTAFLPTSRGSRAAGRILGLGGFAMAIKSFPVLNGLILIGGLRYTGNIQQNASTPAPSENYVCTDPSGNNMICHSGVQSIRHTTTATVFANLLPMDRFALTLSYSGVYARRVPTEDATFDPNDVVTADGTAFVLEGGQQTNRLIFQTLSIAVGFDITSYITASLSYFAFGGWFNASGGAENPLRNRNSAVTLSLQVRPDFLATELRANRARAAQEAQAQRSVASAF